jgi:rhomboid protease GluP
MLGRRRTGSVVCPSCGRLVGAGEKKCPFCGRPAPAMWGLAPLLRKIGGGEQGVWPLVAGGCVVLYVAMLAVDPAGVSSRGGLFGFLAPSNASLLAFGASGAVPVLGHGRWWTLLSAGWLHGNLLHILFNLMWVRQLAPAVAHLYGPGRTLIIYTVASVTGFLASSLNVLMPGFLRLMLGGGQFTVGASAALFGLLGALIHYSRRGGSSALGQQVWTWALALFVFGLILPGIDNWAHLGGFAGGWLLSRWLDPLRPERIDHLIGGGVCLLASAGAVAWSLLTALRIF